MEVFGTITAAIDLVQKITTTFDQAKTNRVEGLLLSSEIIGSLIQIQDLLRQQSLVNSSELQNDLADFENGLRITLARRERLTKGKNKGRWDRSILWCKEAYHSGDIKMELAELRQKIKTCHQNLQIKCMVRIDDGVADANIHLGAIRHMQGTEFPILNQKIDELHELVVKTSESEQATLVKIEAKVEERIAEAEKDSERAQVLVGLLQMNISEASQSLKDTEEALKARSPEENMETKYLKLKVKALGEALPKLVDGSLKLYDGRAVSSAGKGTWTTVFPATAQEGITEDSVQELIRILKLLRSGTDISYPDATCDLERLSGALGDLGLWAETAEIRTWEVQLRRDMAKRGGATFLPDLSLSLANLSYALNEAGLYTEALAASGESVSLCRHRLSGGQVTILSNLAASLSIHSVNLIALGQYDPGKETAEESASIYRTLIEHQEVQYFPNLAMSLTNISHCLSELQRYEDALMTGEESVVIHRKLANELPMRFLPRLADSLVNVSMALIGVGRPQDALMAAEESIVTYRKLAEDQERLFLPRLAKALINASAALNGLGQYDDALRLGEESVKTYRTLLKDHPVRYLPEIAAALINVTITLTALKRYNDATKAGTESVDKYRKLVGHKKGQYISDLAKALWTLSGSLWGVGRNEEALKAGEEAVDIYRKILVDQPAGLDYDLASSLLSVTVSLMGLGRDTDALITGQESIQIFERFLKTCHHPEPFLPTFHSALCTISIAFSQLERHEDALKYATRQVDVSRMLAVRQPRFYRKLAVSLLQLVTIFNKLGRYNDALKPGRESIDVWRQLIKEEGAAFFPHLAMTLENIWETMFRLGRFKNGVKVAEELVDIYRRLVVDQPVQYLRDLLTSLTTLASFNMLLGRHKDEMKVMEELTERLRKLADAEPSQFLPELVLSLGDSSRCLHNQGRHKDALLRVEEAIQLLAKCEKRGIESQIQLAGYLDMKSICLSELSQHEEAIRVGEQAVDIARDQYRIYPDAYRACLSEYLLNYSSALYRKRDLVRSRTAAEESVSHYRILGANMPSQYNVGLGVALGHLCQVLTALGNIKEAKTIAEEASELRLMIFFIALTIVFSRL